MAYNKIINITKPGHLNSAIDYILNPEKTCGEKIGKKALAEMQKSMGEDITGKIGEHAWKGAFVSGINCFPDTAAKKMIGTKKKYGKTDGRLAYHVVQSFAPGEITPEMAHEIGVKYAQAWLGDYEVVIATHLDQGHIHNHLIFNSVSFVDGKKFHMNNNEFYTKLYGISNDLCREYGLSVIENIDSRQMTYEEWMHRHGRGKRTLREIIHEDVAACAAKAGSVGEFFVLMENMGYDIDLSGKHAKIRPLEKDRYYRLSTLGFPDDTLREMIESNAVPERVKKSRTYYGRGVRKKQGHKLTRIEAMYVRWLFVLGKIKPNERRRVSIDEYKKFDRYRQQLKFVAYHRLSGMQDVVNMRLAAGSQMKACSEEKFRLKGAMKGYRDLFEAHRNYKRYLPIADKLEGLHKDRFEKAREVLRKKGYADKEGKIEEKRAELLEAVMRNKKELADLRGGIRMLDDIIESSPKIKQYIQEMEEQKWKEKQQDSYFRGQI